ncbi:MAG: YlxM family DNA-binding protein [Paenibacillus sp.]|nr:YlxM family DNA-binding protein [Paenibacillus sp.]
MSQDNKLEKTNRINLLFAFYERLLTDKQQTFLKYYFHDDFSLGEIAAEFEISRQAVYEHIKRAEQVLENYEDKLGLLGKHESRSHYIDELRRLPDIGILTEEYNLRFTEIVDRLQSLE